MGGGARPAAACAAPIGGPELFRIARVQSDLPEWAREARGRDCGTAELGHKAKLPAAMQACLRDAVEDGKAASGAWSVPTVEGDPIVILAVAEKGQLRTVELSTWDRFSGSAPYVRTCKDEAAAARAVAAAGTKGC